MRVGRGEGRVERGEGRVEREVCVLGEARGG